MNPSGWYGRINEAVDRLSHADDEWTEEIELIELEHLENEVQLKERIQFIDDRIRALQEERRQADSKLSLLKKSEKLVFGPSVSEMETKE